MAPQITVYFHALPQTQQLNGRTKRAGYRKTFVLNRTPLSSYVPRVNGVKATSTAVKVVKYQQRRAPSKNALRNARKRAARAQRKREAQAQTIEAILASIAAETLKAEIPKATKPLVRTPAPSHFMVGSVPVYLPITETVMVTSVEGEDEAPASPKMQDSESTKASTRVSEKSTTEPTGFEKEKVAANLHLKDHSSKPSGSEKGVSTGMDGPFPSGPCLKKQRTSTVHENAITDDKARKQAAAIQGAISQSLAQLGEAPKFQFGSGSYTGPVTRAKARILAETPQELVAGITASLAGPRHAIRESEHSVRLERLGHAVDKVLHKGVKLMTFFDEPLRQQVFLTQDTTPQLQRLGLPENGDSEGMQVMMTGASNLEEQNQQLLKRLAEAEAEMKAMKAHQEAELNAMKERQEQEVVRLAAELVAKANLKQKYVFDEEEAKKRLEQQKKEEEMKEKEKGNFSGAMTPLEIQAMIAKEIQDFQKSLAQPVLGYRKPYPDYFDTIAFPKTYRQPNFDKFDGINSTPHEHLAHFYSACGETSQSDALLVRQFVQSLSGSAFTWYTQLEPGSIKTWDDMQKAFLAQFVNSKKRVTIIDLAEAKQKDNESVNDFITRWRGLNLQCPEKFSELSSVQMCMNNLSPDIATFVATAEPGTFNALVSIACNVERQIARRKSKDTTPKVQFGEKRADNKKSAIKKESMATFVKTDKGNDKGKAREPPRRLTLKERKEVKYSFDSDDVEELFDNLHGAGLIKLPEPKRPAEVNRTNDPKYCRFHRIVSHSLRDCYVFKDKVQEMIDNNQIVLDSPKRADSNMVEIEPIPTVSLPEGAVSVKFDVGNEVTIVQAYPDMPRSGNPNTPTLYELMMAPSLDVWEDSSTSSDESKEGWKTFSRRVKSMPKIPPSGISTHPGVKIRGRPSLRNKKKKKRTQKKVPPSQEEEYEQPPRVPITLTEFLPAEFFSNDSEEEEEDEVVQCCVTFADDEGKKEVGAITLRSGQSIPSADQNKDKGVVESSSRKDKTNTKTVFVSSQKASTSNQVSSVISPANELRGDKAKTMAKDAQKSHKARYDILAHLKRIPALVSVYDALRMSSELREALIMALTSPEFYQESIETAESAVVVSQKACTCCQSKITFDDSDRLLGFQDHNRPLYVSGQIGDTSVRRIMLDCGSAVSIISLKTLRSLGMEPRQLSPSTMTIQGFNQEGQRVMGTIGLQCKTGELISRVFFYVIDAKTSYNVLLGRPWLHTYGVVPSTLHQCFKFVLNGKVKKVVADTDPFEFEEVNYSDAKWYKPPGFVIVSQDDETTKSVGFKTELAKQKAEAAKQPQQIRIKLTGKYRKSDKPKTLESETSKVSRSAQEEVALRSIAASVGEGSTNPKPEAVFKYSVKAKREPGQKALSPVEDTMTSLMTSYTRPLRKIDQSIPEGSLVISVQKNGDHGKRVVSYKDTSMASTPVPLKIKIKRRKAKNGMTNLTVQLENGMLRASFPEQESEGPKLEILIDCDKDMFKEV